MTHPFMKLFKSAADRRIARFQKDSNIGLDERGIAEIAEQYPYSYDDIRRLHDALPANKRNKAYIELLVKTLSAKATPISALIEVLQGK